MGIGLTAPIAGRLRPFNLSGKSLTGLQPISDTSKLHLMGPPGAGKTTLLDILKQHGITVLDTSVVLAGATDEEVRRIIRQHKMEKKLVPDKYVIPLVTSAMAALDGDSVIAGFPRSYEQARAVTASHFAERRYALFVRLTLDDGICTRRLLKRWVCESDQCKGKPFDREKDQEKVCPSCGSQLTKRDDDTAEGIAERLRIYHEEADVIKLHLAHYYGNDPCLGAYIEVGADQDTASQAREILAFLYHVMGKDVCL